MLDWIGDLFELFGTDGVPSPDTLRGQRLARLAVAASALATNLVVHATRSSMATGHSWSVLVLLGGSFAGLWVLLFSAVDLVKELPSVPWVSVLAAGTGSAAVAIAVLAFRSRLIA
jgi:hypothetical protein